MSEEKEAAKLEQIRHQVEGVISNLSPMRREFVIHYLHSSNATQSAARAGYAYPNKLGPKLSKHPVILDAIDAYFGEKEMRAREAVSRLSDLARAGYSDYFYWDETAGEIRVDLERMVSDGRAYLIKAVVYVRAGDDYRQVVKFYNAQQALVDIGRYHGLFTDKTDITSGGEAIPFQEIVAALQRASKLEIGQGDGRLDPRPVEPGI